MRGPNRPARTPRKSRTLLPVWQASQRRTSQTAAGMCTIRYCAYGPPQIERDDLVVRCVRRGVDIEVLHVDVPPDMELFAGARAEADGARKASRAIQIPVYSSLTDEQTARVAAVVRDVLLAV